MEHALQNPRAGYRKLHHLDLLLKRPRLDPGKSRVGPGVVIAHVTDEQIVALLDAGLSRSELAAHYGVGDQVIRYRVKILRGRGFLPQKERPCGRFFIDDLCRAEEDRALRADIARRKLADRFGDLTDADLVAAAQAAGRACWQQWHSSCVNKKKLAAFSDVSARISLTQAAWLLDLVDQTTAKAAHLRDNLTASGNTVDWPDDAVANAVESLAGTIATKPLRKMAPAGPRPTAAAAIGVTG